MQENYGIDLKDLEFVCKEEEITNESETSEQIRRRLTKNKLETAIEHFSSNTQKIAVALKNELDELYGRNDNHYSSYSRKKTDKIYLAHIFLEFATLDKILEVGLLELLNFLFGEEEAKQIILILKKDRETGYRAFYNGIYKMSGFPKSSSPFYYPHFSASVLNVERTAILICNSTCLSVNADNLIADLKNYCENRVYGEGFPYGTTSFYTCLIAVEIDKGNEELISYLEDILISVNSKALIESIILRGILLSNNKNLVELLLSKCHHEKMNLSTEFMNVGEQSLFSLLKFISDNKAEDSFTEYYEYKDNDIQEVLLIENIINEILDGEQNLLDAIYCDDKFKVFAGLWCVSFVNKEAILPLPEKLLKSKNTEIKLIALYFLETCDFINFMEKYIIPIVASENFLNEDFNFQIAILDILDLDRLSYMNTSRTMETLKTNCKDYKFLDSQKVRENLFNNIIKFMEKYYCEKDFEVRRAPFYWINYSVNHEILSANLIIILAYSESQTDLLRLMQLLENKATPTDENLLGSPYRYKFWLARKFIQPENSKEERKFIFDFLNIGHNSFSLGRVDEKFKNLKLTEEEIIILSKRLPSGYTLLNSSGRLIIPSLLLTQEKSLSIFLINYLLKRSMKERLFAVRILFDLYKSEMITINEMDEFLNPDSFNEEEKIIIHEFLKKSKADYKFDAEITLFDTERKIDLTQFSAVCLSFPTGLLNKFRDISAEKMIQAFNNLIILVTENKNHKYSTEYCRAEREFTLGKTKNSWKALLYDGEYPYSFDRLVLNDVWEKWLNSNIDSYALLYKINYALSILSEKTGDISNLDYIREVIGYDYDDYCYDFLEKEIGFKEAVKFNNYYKNKNFEFYGLAKTIFYEIFKGVEKGLEIVSEKETLSKFVYNLHVDMISCVPEEHIKEFFLHKRFYLRNLELEYSYDDEFFEKVLRLEYFKDSSYMPEIWCLVKAVNLGLIEKEILVSKLFNSVSKYVGREDYRIKDYRDKVSENDAKLLDEIMDDLKSKLYDI